MPETAGQAGWLPGFAAAAIVALPFAIQLAAHALLSLGLRKRELARGEEFGLDEER
jgi:threonine/homoserine efflux transporter RhtA